MSATTWCVVYNGGESPQLIDEEGHSVDPTSWACARRSIVRDLIDRGDLVVVDIDSIGPDSNPAARLAAEEAQKRNEEIDAAKAADEPAPAKETAKPKPSSNKN